MGKRLAHGNGNDWIQDGHTFKIDGRNLQCYFNGSPTITTGVITDDGNSIITTADGISIIYKRER